MLSSEPSNKLLPMVQDGFSIRILTEKQKYLSNAQKQILLPLFIQIFTELQIALPPELFQFEKIISENVNELTELNIIRYNITTFLLELISMDTPEHILGSVLSIIRFSIIYSDDLFESFLSNEIIEILPRVFSYSSVQIQTIISDIFRNLTDIERVTVPTILQCTASFLVQSVYWIADHQSEECKLNCLFFLYNVIIGSNKNLPQEMIFHLSRSLLAQLLNENLEIVSLAAWSIEALIKNYKISLALHDVFTYIFINIPNAFDTEAAIPLLHMIIASLRILNNYPPANEYVPLVNWPYLLSKIADDNVEISYLSCRLINLLINENPEVIEILLSCNILNACLAGIKSQRYKPIRSIVLLLRSFWMYGTIAQQRFVVLHPSSVAVLPYLSIDESETNIGCVQALHQSLNRLIENEAALLPNLQQIYTNDVISPLANSNNTDVSHAGQLMLELLGYEM